MQSDNYRNNIIEALKNLKNVNESIYRSVIDISMQGELKEWNDTIDIGEIFQFDFDLFKNSNDTNVQLLIELIEKIDSTFNTLKNVNAISEEEV